jgi:hypothetical protein
MPRGVVGDSMDRATDKMDQMISRSKGTSYKKLSILDQLKQAFPDTWKEELKRERAKYAVK